MASEKLTVTKPDQLPPKQVNWRSELERFVLVVDGQTKSSYADQAAAEKEAKRLGDTWPILSVRVEDRG